MKGRKKKISFIVLLAFLLSVVDLPVLAEEIEIPAEAAINNLFDGFVNSELTTGQALAQIMQNHTSSESFTETCSFLVLGDAVLRTDQSVSLVPVEENRSGAIYSKEKLSIGEGVILEFDFYMGEGTTNGTSQGNGADGIAVSFAPTRPVAFAVAEEMGFYGKNAVGVEFDTWNNYFRGDPEGDHVGIIQDSVGKHLATGNCGELDDSRWHSARIVYAGQLIGVYVDGELVADYDGVRAMDEAYIGITASTGSYTNNHFIKNVKINGNSIMINPAQSNGESSGYDVELPFFVSNNIDPVPIQAYWNVAFFSGSSSQYNHQLAKLSMIMSNDAYDKNSIQEGLSLLGFQCESFFYEKACDDRAHTSAFSLAHKKMVIDETEYELFAIVVRGTKDAEWYSNMDFAGGVNHSDMRATNFNESAKIIEAGLEEYLSKYSSVLDRKKIKFWITGHSRGAAVANLVAADLNDKYAKSQIYAYTFATPNVDKNINSADEYAYNNIFNIVNPEDFVRYLPLKSWGYSKYGVTLELPSKKNYSRYNEVLSVMKQYYYNLMGENYAPFKDGGMATAQFTKDMYRIAANVDEYYNKKHFLLSGLLVTPYEYFNLVASVACGDAQSMEATGMLIFNAVDSFSVFGYGAISRYLIGYHGIDDALGKPTKLFNAHGMTTYYSWLCAVDETVLKQCTRNPPKVLVVACPVDVYVYDSENNLVASVVEDIIVKDQLEIAVTTNGIKQIAIPGDEAYQVVIEARESGSMTYIVTEYDADMEIARMVNFYEIPLEAGALFQGAIPAGNDNSTESYNLTVTTNDVTKTIICNEDLTRDDIDYVSVDVIVEGDGYATSSQMTEKATLVTLEAQPVNDSCFAGWYSREDTLLSTEQQYRFIVKDDVKIIAKFIAKADFDVNLSGTITSYGDANAETSIRLLQDGAEVYTTTGTGNSTSYEFPNVAAGTYEMEVSKQGHATYREIITVGGEELTIDRTLLLLGDVDGDGDVDITDAMIIVQHIQGMLDLSSNTRADMDGKGEIDITDAMMIVQYIQGTIVCS